MKTRDKFFADGAGIYLGDSALSVKPMASMTAVTDSACQRLSPRDSCVSPACVRRKTVSAGA